MGLEIYNSDLVCKIESFDSDKFKDFCFLGT
jgi:hypothetical protein